MSGGVSQAFTGFSFTDPQYFNDPFPAYEALLNDHPVAYDPKTNFYLITRYEDVRAIVLDPTTYSSHGWMEAIFQAMDPARAERIQKRYAEKGWVYGPNVGFLDDPRHREVRGLFDNALRPAKVKTMEPLIQAVVDRLIGNLAGNKPHEIVHELADPLPLFVICTQVGAPQEDIWKIKDWCFQIFKKNSLLLPQVEEMACIDREIEAQHYFMALIHRLRDRPDGTVLSDIINTPLSDGSPLRDEEALNNLIYTLFLAGSETTAFATAGGIRLLCEHPGLFTKLKGGSEDELKLFVEEVLRLESPSTGSWRITTKEVELHGVKIPKGAVIHVRFAAANRDARQFACPAQLDLERKNVRKHMAFGGGIHSCVGSTLARTELQIAFRGLFKTFDGVRLAFPDRPIEYNPHYGFRTLKELYVEFN